MAFRQSSRNISCVFLAYLKIFLRVIASGVCYFLFIWFSILTVLRACTFFKQFALLCIAYHSEPPRAVPIQNHKLASAEYDNLSVFTAYGADAVIIQKQFLRACFRNFLFQKSFPIELHFRCIRIFSSFFINEPYASIQSRLCYHCNPKKYHSQTNAHQCTPNHSRHTVK